MAARMASLAIRRDRLRGAPRKNASDQLVAPGAATVPRAQCRTSTSGTTSFAMACWRRVPTVAGISRTNALCDAHTTLGSVGLGDGGDDAAIASRLVKGPTRSGYGATLSGERAKIFFSLPSLLSRLDLSYRSQTQADLHCFPVNRSPAFNPNLSRTSAGGDSPLAPIVRSRHSIDPPISCGSAPSLGIRFVSEFLLDAQGAK